MSEQDKKSSKLLLEKILGVDKVEKLWTANYNFIFPFTPQGYSLEAVLAGIFFLFRWGYRRGKGKFFESFGDFSVPKHSKARQNVTINDVSDKLVKSEYFSNFDELTEKAILGDLLLSFCLENKAHKLGRKEPLSRVYPTHYLASWIDLPDRFSSLRGVPEMLVCILADCPNNEYIDKHNCSSKYLKIINNSLEDNLLLKIFSQGTNIQSRSSNLTSDRFQEECQSVGIDQLLTIRVAQACKEPPGKAAGGKDKIDNQIPLPKEAVKFFREDFTIFIQSYQSKIPRQSLLPMLESCLSLSISNIYLSTVDMLLKWEREGKLPQVSSPWPLFIDCSNNSEGELRRLSEESTDELIRLLGRIPIILMSMRVLETLVINLKLYMRKEKEAGKIPNPQPQATDYINFLGSIMMGEHSQAERIKDDIEEACNEVANTFGENTDSSILLNILNNPEIHPAKRLAETITILMGDALQQANFIEFMESSLMINAVNGLGTKRRRTNTVNKQTKTSYARSIILSNTMIDFLVHCQIAQAGQQRLSLSDFIKLLRERYGLYIDQSPPNISVSQELLSLNKRFLERRLRDLGLLVGVNDAELMKKLKSRF